MSIAIAVLIWIRISNGVFQKQVAHSIQFESGSAYSLLRMRSIFFHSVCINGKRSFSNTSWSVADEYRATKYFNIEKDQFMVQSVITIPLSIIKYNDEKDYNDRGWDFLIWRKAAYQCKPYIVDWAWFNIYSDNYQQHFTNINTNIYILLSMT